jgi:hypothetical protein
MGKRNQPENNAVAAPATQPVTTGNEKRIERPVTYVVVRDGYRVSDREYSSAGDAAIINEHGFWSRVAKKHSHGEPVTIVQYDSKKHRVW